MYTVGGLSGRVTAPSAPSLCTPVLTTPNGPQCQASRQSCQSQPIMYDRFLLDSMASDSSLLKAAPASCPQYPFQSRHAKARRSTPWRLVVALVLLLVAIMGLAALAYLQQMELIDMRDSVADMKSKLQNISEEIQKLQKNVGLVQDTLFVVRNDIRNDSRNDSHFDYDSSFDYDTRIEDNDDDDETSEADLDLTYFDTEDTNVVEGKAHDREDGGRPPVPRLEPASGHHQPVDAGDATSTTTSPPLLAVRRRRDVRDERLAGRPQPQLKLYHMLQTPGLSAAAPPPEQPWSQYGALHPQDRAYGHGRPQPMYAERAPMAFVPAPQPQRHVLGYAATTVAPIASRRSRVMDGVGTSPGPGQQQHRRRHQHRSQPQQQQRHGGFQLQNLQDVTQEVPQGGAARSVDVGRPRWQQQQQQQQQWPSSTPRPSSWSPRERFGRWRDPWQERVRATRVTDTLQR